MQSRTLKLLANVNTVNENDDSNKVIVSNNSSSSTNSQARICTFNYSSSSSSSSSSTFSSSAPTYDQRTAHIWNYDILHSHMKQEIVQYHDIAAAHEN